MRKLTYFKRTKLHVRRVALRVHWPSPNLRRPESDQLATLSNFGLRGNHLCFSHELAPRNFGMTSYAPI